MFTLRYVFASVLSDADVADQSRSRAYTTRRTALITDVILPGAGVKTEAEADL